MGINITEEQNVRDAVEIVVVNRWGHDVEEANEVINEINSQTGWDVPYLKEKRIVTVSFTVTVSFDDCLVSEDADTSELFDAAQEASGLSYLSDCVEATSGDLVDVSLDDAWVD